MSDADLWALRPGLDLAAGGLAVALRLIAATWVVPFAGGRLVPVAVRIALGLVLGLVLMPQLMPQIQTLVGKPPLFLGAVLAKELLIGLALGYLLSLVFWAVEAAGRLMDSARGVPWTGSPTALDDQGSPLSSLLVLLSVLLFFMLGGHHIFILALSASFEALPLAGFPGVQGVRQFALLCVEAGGALFLLALTLAAPVLGSLLLADVALGWLGRSSHSGGALVVSLAPGLRAVLGLGLLLLTVALLAQIIPALLEQGLAQLRQGIGLLGGAS